MTPSTTAGLGLRNRFFSPTYVKSHLRRPRPTLRCERQALQSSSLYCGPRRGWNLPVALQRRETAGSAATPPLYGIFSFSCWLEETRVAERRTPHNTTSHHFCDSPPNSAVFTSLHGTPEKLRPHPFTEHSDRFYVTGYQGPLVAEQPVTALVKAYFLPGGTHAKT